MRRDKEDEEEGVREEEAAAVFLSKDTSGLYRDLGACQQPTLLAWPCERARARGREGERAMARHASSKSRSEGSRGWREETRRGRKGGG